MTSRGRRVLKIKRLALWAACALAGAAWSATAAAQSDAEEELDGLLGEEAEGQPAEGGEPGEESKTFLPATSTFEGGSGLFRLSSAQTGKEMTFRLSLMGQIFSGEDVVRANDEASRFTGTLGISATPLPWLEPYLVLKASSASNTFSSPETVLAQGDANLGVKGVYGLAPGFDAGADLRLIFLTGPGTTSFDLGATGVRFALLGTFDGRQLAEPLPLKAHLNLGFFADSSDQLLPEDSEGRKLIPSRVDRFTQGVSAFSQILFGLGVEVPLEYVTPSLEYNLGVLTGEEPDPLCLNQPLGCPSKSGFSGNPQALTLGVKTMPLEGLVLNLALDLGLTGEDVQGVPATAPFNVIFGMTYAFDPRAREKIVIQEKIVEKDKIVNVKPPASIIVGTVLDADTDKPVAGAVVHYVDQGVSRQVTDAETGGFRSYELAPGVEVELEISAAEYKTRKVKQALVEGEVALEVKIKPEGKTGVVKVVARDDKGQPLKSGALLLTGPKTYTVQLDGNPVEQKVLAGQYTVAITSAGFLTAGRDLDVEPKQDHDVAIDLKVRPEEAIVSVGETRILMDGRLQFSKEEDALEDSARAKLDQVVSALLEHPEFTRVRVEGHWDDSGAADKRIEITQKRARAVMDYLVSRGISPKRLEARGFGSEVQLVPNSSARNRAINQRIEFAIISTSNAREQ